MNNWLADDKRELARFPCIDNDLECAAKHRRDKDVGVNDDARWLLSPREFPHRCLQV